MKREGKEMKKIFSVIVAVFMIASLTTKTIFAEDNIGMTFTDSNFTYTVTANKTVSVSKNDKNNEIETCDIPETVENNGITYTVTSIGVEGFKELTKLKTVKIPATVTVLGNSSFYGCNQLTSVNIPESVITIGESAFSHCSQLESIHIPESVTTIERAAFYECDLLKTVNLPKKLTVLKQNIFYNCESLTSITIPNNVTEIRSNAFLGTGLTSIVIPSSVKKIDGCVFWECGNLTLVTLSNDIESISGEILQYSNLPKSVMAVTSNKNDSISAVITDGLKYKVEHYLLGVTEIESKQDSVTTHPNSTLSLDEYFSVFATVYEGKNPTNTVSIPEEYRQPQYSLVSGATGKTRIEDSKLIIDPQQSDNLIVKATLNKQEVELSVNVIQSPIIGIEINQEPRLAYTEGDTFNPNGLQLKVNYENGTSDIVEYNENTKNDFKFTVNSPLTLNDNKVIITYAGFPIELELTVYRKAIIVTPDQNSITGLEDKYEQGNTLNVIVKGAGMDNQEPTEGDTRYKPVSWEISTPHQFINDSYGISMNTKSLQLGNHQLKVKFEKQLFNGIEWVTKETFDLEKNFEVVEVSQGEVIPTPKPTPTPNETSTPNVTPTPNETKKPSSESSQVNTNDTTFIVGFVALMIVSGSVLFVNLKKKKNY